MVNPEPRLNWGFNPTNKDQIDFDVIGQPPQSLTFTSDTLNNQKDILTIEKPLPINFGDGMYSGYAEKILFGDHKIDANCFDFFTTNTDFLRVIYGGSIEFTPRDIEFVNRCVNENSEPNRLSVSLNNDWIVEFETSPEALNWMIPKQANRGSIISLRMRLLKTHSNYLNSPEIANLENANFSEAITIAFDLCRMLSYANGGFIYPVYSIARKIDDCQDIILAAIAEARILSPIEEIGQGFIPNCQVNTLIDFLSCFPNFQKLMENSHWHSKWDLIEWYFQSIMRLGGRRRNQLIAIPVNSVGALLENLAYLVLVDDEPHNSSMESEWTPESEWTAKKSQRKQLGYGGYDGSTDYHIDRLLKKIGISNEKNLVQQFVHLRNNSTHAENKPTGLSEREEWDLLQLSVQWVDEVILWRLEYTCRYGKSGYIERKLESDEGIAPRFQV